MSSSRDQLPIRFIGVLVGAVISAIILGLIGANNMNTIWGPPLLVLDFVIFGLGGVVLGFREHVKFLGRPCYSPMMPDPQDRARERGELWIEKNIFEMTEALFVELILKIEDWKGIDLLKQIYKQFKNKELIVDAAKLKEDMETFQKQVEEDDKKYPGSNDKERAERNTEKIAKLALLNSVVKEVWPLKDSKGDIIHAFYMQVRDSELLGGLVDRNQVIFTYEQDWRNQFAWTAMRGAESVYKGNWIYAMDYTTCAVSPIFTVRMRPEIYESKRLLFLKDKREVSRDVPFFALVDSHKMRLKARDDFAKNYSAYKLAPRPEIVESLSLITKVVANAPYVEEIAQLKERVGELVDIVSARIETVLYANFHVNKQGRKMNWMYTTIIIAAIAAFTILALWRR